MCGEKNVVMQKFYFCTRKYLSYWEIWNVGLHSLNSVFSSFTMDSVMSKTWTQCLLTNANVIREPIHVIQQKIQNPTGQPGLCSGFGYKAAEERSLDTITDGFLWASNSLLSIKILPLMRHEITDCMTWFVIRIRILSCFIYEYLHKSTHLLL